MISLNNIFLSKNEIFPLKHVCMQDEESQSEGVGWSRAPGSASPTLAHIQMAIRAC